MNLRSMLHTMTWLPLVGLLAVSPPVARAAEPESVSLAAMVSPVIFRGDAATAYRDPAVVYHDGWFRLFFSLVRIEPGAGPFSYAAWSKSRDLVRWSEPELLRVKGPDVAQDEMGRMIDAYLVADKDQPGKWWCFYKQAGMSMSWSNDLKTWTYAGRISAGENACVIVDGDDYVLFHSPANGVGIKRSGDLRQWRDEGLLTLGQKSWPWAQGRLTAGFVLDLRDQPTVGKALMFFHGSEFPENDPRGGFDNHASIGLAWSDDLRHWAWPGGDGDK